MPEMTGYQGNSALGQSGHAGGIPRQPWGVISLLGETTYEGLGFRPMELGAATQGAPAEGPKHFAQRHCFAQCLVAKEKEFLVTLFSLAGMGPRAWQAGSFRL